MLVSIVCVLNEWMMHLYSAFSVLLYTQSALQSCGGSLLNHHQWWWFSLSDTHTHTHVWFCKLWGFTRNGFYTVQTIFSITLPLTGNFVHFCFLKKKTNSVWFINLLKYGDMGKCPHKSPSPCKTYDILMSLYKLVSSCHKNAHTQSYSWSNPGQFLDAHKFDYVAALYCTYYFSLCVLLSLCLSL